MNILVTGATGFVGSHVARLLLARGNSVRVLVRASSDLRALNGLAVERVTGDLRDAATLPAALAGMQRVFHVAADYRLWARDTGEIYESNVTGTRNLLAAAREAGVEKFVYTSTVATIAVPREGALPNEATAATLEEMIGHYKRSKFLAEQEALRAAAGGVPVVIVNPTAPVGPGDWKPTPTGKIILDFLQGKMPAYLDTGLNVVPVEDCAEGHLLAADRGRAGERYILGGRNMALKEILDTLARVVGRHAPRIRLPHAVALAAGYVENAFSRALGREPQIPLEGVRMARHKMFVEGSKAVRELGYQPGPVEAALERAVLWYEENGYVKPHAQHGAVRVAA
ncbi:MAG: NAD-dependent epimerase/dehydratase family protein [Acidobacteria bacterium]|nr:NAD-dependent epimerase/dehydratase family protein [Acidobacteriota bacterium]MCL5287626.1 NAD-dependent epimerase/dehydratase family protein [Acidobacteriota bacterium]